VFALAGHASIISGNNTRQGYVLRNTLKLAGYLFLGFEFLALKKPNKNRGLA